MEELKNIPEEPTLQPEPMALQKAIEKNPHLKEYLDKFVEKGNPMPDFYTRLEKEMGSIEFPNVIYMAGDPVYIHIYRKHGDETRYYAIEPEITREESDQFNKIFDALLMEAQIQKEPSDKEELRNLIGETLDRICPPEDEKIENNPLKNLAGVFSVTRKFPINEEFKNKLKYTSIKKIIGMGILEPLSRDPYIEDIFGSGLGAVFVAHKIFGMMISNIILKSDIEVDDFCTSMGERMDKPLSDAIPIADGTLPDGSRANIIYTRSISKRGSSFSIRKLVAEPLSIARIITFGTINAEMAAYLWLALDNGMNVFFCGESSSGKTAFLNASCAFIEPKAKIYTCEDTVEVTAPHTCWQQLTTSTSGMGENATGVEMQDLLIASLRSRPNYIIVGEIRGAEGNVAFQAMQTGHPVMSTFHSSSVRKMIQRLTGNPILVPVNFMDNLNISIIMGVIHRKGVMLRRVMEIAEIEGYNDEAGGILTRSMFDWDPITDQHIFKGMFNSFILEDKIATARGYLDKRQIYADLDERARIIQGMVDRKIFDYFEVFEIIRNYWYYGKESLPFEI